MTMNADDSSSSLTTSPEKVSPAVKPMRDAGRAMVYTLLSSMPSYVAWGVWGRYVNQRGRWLETLKDDLQDLPIVCVAAFGLEVAIRALELRFVEKKSRAEVWQTLKESYFSCQSIAEIGKLFVACFAWSMSYEAAKHFIQCPERLMQYVVAPLLSGAGMFLGSFLFGLAFEVPRCYGIKKPLSSVLLEAARSACGGAVWSLLGDTLGQSTYGMSALVGFLSGLAMLAPDVVRLGVSSLAFCAHRAKALPDAERAEAGESVALLASPGQKERRPACPCVLL